jgi:hypothetical protein
MEQKVLMYTSLKKVPRASSEDSTKLEGSLGYTETLSQKTNKGRKE